MRAFTHIVGPMKHRVTSLCGLDKLLVRFSLNLAEFMHRGKSGTGKLYTDVCLCCSAHTSGCVVDSLGATAAF